jgi:hypothetical protein
MIVIHVNRKVAATCERARTPLSGPVDAILKTLELIHVVVHWENIDITTARVGVDDVHARLDHWEILVTRPVFMSQYVHGHLGIGIGTRKNESGESHNNDQANQ